MLLPWKIAYKCRVSPIDSVSESLSPPSWSKSNAISVSTPYPSSVFHRRCSCCCLHSVAQGEEEKVEENFSSTRNKKWPQNLDSKPSTTSSEGRTETKFEEMKKKNKRRRRSSPSRIQVPRQRYIPVSKSELMEAILSMLRSGKSPHDSIIRQFLQLTSCLDSVLHAEHKAIIEEMRADYYSLTHSDEGAATVPVRGGVILKAEGEEGEKAEKEREGQEGDGDNAFSERDICVDRDHFFESSSGDMAKSENQVPLYNPMDLMQVFGSSSTHTKIDEESSSSGVAAASRFQLAFRKLLFDARFEELSVRDLILTSNLNTDYLLTLPIYVDWKKASESNAIIFRRGYATEKQKGLLLVEKLDYLQSKLLEAIFGLLSKPIGKLGVWINEAVGSICKTKEVQALRKKIHLWVGASSLFQGSQSLKEQTSNVMPETEDQSFIDLPIWVAAQRAVGRYEGILSSVGPRGRLLKRFFTAIGLAPAIVETPFDQNEDNTSVSSEPYLMPVFLSRISLADIWKPATTKYCGNDIWKVLGASFKIIFSESVLQEPAFEELVLLYTEEVGRNSTQFKSQIPSLQLKIYEKIPIPDLPVIFPQKKLSYRILDTVRLDIASVLGLLAFFINYKFEDVLSSPSALLLDVVALSALVIFAIRLALGYKQTWDRYQLLINRTLYEKTLASGFGTVHFLLDASEQQQFKECVLAYAALLNLETDQTTCRRGLGEACEQFLYYNFNVKVEMPIDAAVDKLVKFGLVTEKTVSEDVMLEVVPCSAAYDVLREQWNCLLG